MPGTEADPGVTRGAGGSSAVLCGPRWLVSLLGGRLRQEGRLLALRNALHGVSGAPREHICLTIR